LGERQSLVFGDWSLVGSSVLVIGTYLLLAKKIEMFSEKDREVFAKRSKCFL